ncbi:hypothetical protein WJX75_001966 [Coccomyxa subellipsoidea]|uniref:Blue (type 1) copper domain-containing protein n=1 Tax=Coccomyxa subellipsoidea TaxID=248742 RepID=A0ABR2YWZ5_9CHLO
MFRYNLPLFSLRLNEMTPGLEVKLPPTDVRRRWDLRALEQGDYDKPFYQQGITASFPSVPPIPSASSAAVSTIDPWDYGNLYPDINVTAGTAVRFVWHNIAHGVNGITSRICPQNFTSDPTIVQLAPVTNGGDYTTPPLSPGDHFYACPVFGHCLGGMMQAVHVLGQGQPAPLG